MSKFLFGSVMILLLSSCTVVTQKNVPVEQWVPFETRIGENIVRFRLPPKTRTYLPIAHEIAKYEEEEALIFKVGLDYPFGWGLTEHASRLVVILRTVKYPNPVEQGFSVQNLAALAEGELGYLKPREVLQFSDLTNRVSVASGTIESIGKQSWYHATSKNQNDPDDIDADALLAPLDTTQYLALTGTYRWFNARDRKRVEKNRELFLEIAKTVEIVRANP